MTLWPEAVVLIYIDHFHTEVDLTGPTLLACGAPDDDEESVRGGHFEGRLQGRGVGL